MTEFPVRNFRDLFVLRATKDDGIVVSPGTSRMRPRSPQNFDCHSTPTTWGKSGDDWRSPGRCAGTRSMRDFSVHREQFEALGALPRRPQWSVAFRDQAEGLVPL